MRNRLIGQETKNTNLTQIAKMCELPPEAALISDLRAFSAGRNRAIQRSINT